jgi:hypothetical protein
VRKQAVPYDCEITVFQRKLFKNQGFQTHLFSFNPEESADSFSTLGDSGIHAESGYGAKGGRTEKATPVE